MYNVSFVHGDQKKKRPESKIRRLEAYGNCTIIHFDDGLVVIKCWSMKRLLLALDSKLFVRLDRKHAVNVKHIVSYEPEKNYLVKVSDGFETYVSCRRRDEFEEITCL